MMQSLKSQKSFQKQSHKIALYIRVSTEEQAENPEGSIRNQEARLRETVKLKNHIDGNFGEISTVYKDVMSGKDANRPQLQKLLTAIRNKEVSLIMVSELSRLSRNMRDFAEMWELMRSNDCGILSLRENFDTTTAAGEMVLYTIANIAQFERRQTAERTKASLRSRAQRGLYNGGPVPYGYGINPDKRGYLFILPEEAKIVQKSFEAFLKEQSLCAAAKWLNQNGYQRSKTRIGGGYPRLGIFTFDNLARLLKNKSYIGIRQFWTDDVVEEVAAVWEPIIDRTTFERVQELLQKNVGKRKPESFKKHPYILSNLVKCKTCGDALPGKSAHGNGGKFAYYEHGWVIRKHSGLVKKVFSCQPMRIQAKILEPIVWKLTLEMLHDQTLQKKMLDNAQITYQKHIDKPELERMKNRLDGMRLQLEALAERLAQLPKSVSAAPIFKQMEKIEELKAKEERALRDFESQNSEDGEKVVHLAVYREFLNGLKKLSASTLEVNPDICRQIVQKLVHRVEILPEGLRVGFYVGEDYFEREKTLETESHERVQNDGSDKSALFFKNNGSHTLTNGVADGD